MKRVLNRTYLSTLAAFVLLLLLGAPAAQAQKIDISLDQPNNGISAYTGPYGTVTVTLVDATHAIVTFEANPGFMFNGVALNVNGTATVSDVTWDTLAGFDPSFTGSNTSSGNMDGFGSFNLRLDNLNDKGFPGALQSITFTLTATGTTSWADVSSVLFANGNGYVAAAHTFVCADPGCTFSSGAAATGFSANGNPVPEPASIALFGSGLVGLAGLIRRRRKTSASA